MDQSSGRQVGGWLAVCCVLLFLMVVMGDVTRLTRSGLSIVEWKPLVGTIPPLSQTDWEEVFLKYRATPEYLHVNKGVALDLLQLARVAAKDSRRGLGRYAPALAELIFLMSLSGGFVAGIRAGFPYNTFPLMNGNFVPPEIMMLEPWWMNLFNNMATAQFNHRMLAWVLMVLGPAFWLMARRVQLPPSARLATHLVLAMLVIQVTLGIPTLLLAVPVALAVAHQGGAVLLLSAALWAAHELHAA